MKKFWLLSIGLFALAISNSAAPSLDWPQFRGPGGNAVSESALPPIHFGPSTNLLWKTPLSSGYSSPIVSGGRIFLTSHEAGLETLAVDGKDGRILWRRTPLPEQTTREQKTPEPVSLFGLDQILPTAPIKNPTGGGRAASTPVTDGQFVYSFFGTFGLVAYDLEGKEQWRRPLPKPDGAITASPILIDDKIIVVCDVGPGSFVEAIDKKSGKLIWRTEREHVRRSLSTPFHWVNDKRDELIVSGFYWLTSYDPRTGKENWQYSGTAKSNVTPVAAPSLLIAATSQMIFDGGADLADGDSSSGSLANLDHAESAVLAIRACGRGEVNETHLAWKKTRSLPDRSSPVIYKNRLFTVKSGGFVSAYDLKDGKIIYQDERLNTPGDYFASPVAADGRLYFISHNGIATVIDANSDTLAILAQNKIGEQTLATPALAGSNIVIRTEKALYAFASAK